MSPYSFPNGTSLRGAGGRQVEVRCYCSKETGETGEGDFSCVATWTATPSTSGRQTCPLRHSGPAGAPPAGGRPLHAGREWQQLNAQLLRKSWPGNRRGGPSLRNLSTSGLVPNPPVGGVQEGGPRPGLSPLDVPPCGDESFWDRASPTTVMKQMDLSWPSS